MGHDSLGRYLDRSNKKVIVLCRTSDRGGSELQFFNVGTGERLFERVAPMSIH